MTMTNVDSRIQRYAVAAADYQDAQDQLTAAAKTLYEAYDRLRRGLLPLAPTACHLPDGRLIVVGTDPPVSIQGDGSSTTVAGWIFAHPSWEVPRDVQSAVAKERRRLGAEALPRGEE